LALVFKCLTDNILLDDFKSVLQRLSNMKEDRTTAILPNAINVDTNEKTGSTDHHEEAFGESSSRGRRGQPLDHSSTMPDYDQPPDDSENEFKMQGMAANAVGKLGIKIHKLPKLPS
jgi:hypothetical protein